MLEISILGCGWLGMPLGEYLVNKGYDVKGSTTNASKLSIIRNTGMEPFLINLEPDFKGESHFLDSELLILTLPPRNNLSHGNYKEQIARLVEKVGRSTINKLIYISSISVYPNNNDEVKEADASKDCLSRSGVSLVEIEEIIKNSDVSSTILRFGGLYGPNRHPGNFLAGKTNLSGANNPINMIHLDDCIGVIETVIQQNLWNETFNACSPNHPEKKVFYENASLELGTPLPQFSTDQAPFKLISSEKFTAQSGYQFIH